jgi:membrane protease YdiL (CAAX protease family)
MIAKRIAKHLGVFLLWNIFAGLSLFLLPAPVGIAVALLLAWVLLHRYLLRSHDPDRERYWATLRLRPLPPRAARWMVAAVPALIVLSWALGEVYVRIVPVPPETFNPFGAITRTPLGRLSIAVLAIGVAPVLEEFFFRGLIQRPLERRWGPGPAIIAAAAIFALVHLLPWVFPLHLFLGIAFGWVVYVTRSIWAGVILHAANNAAAVMGLNGGEEQPLRPTLWQTGLTADWWTAVASLVVSALIAAWVAQRLWQAGIGNAERGMRNAG